MSDSSSLKDQVTSAASEPSGCESRSRVEWAIATLEYVIAVAFVGFVGSMLACFVIAGVALMQAHHAIPSGCVVCLGFGFICLSVALVNFGVLVVLEADEDAKLLH